MDENKPHPLPEDGSEERPGRRRFLQSSLLVILSGQLMYFLQQYLTFPLKKVQIVEFFLASSDQQPQLDLVKHQSPVFLIITGGGQTLLSDQCPHLGCQLHFRSDRQDFLCPCHGSRFNREGKWLEGPAGKDMRALQAERSKDRITVRLNDEDA